MVVLKIISVALTSSAVITGWDSSLISWVLKGGGGGGEGARTFSLSVLVCPSPLQMKTSVPGRNTVKTIITF